MHSFGAFDAVPSMLLAGVEWHGQTSDALFGHLEAPAVQSTLLVSGCDDAWKHHGKVKASWTPRSASAGVEKAPLTKIVSCPLTTQDEPDSALCLKEACYRPNSLVCYNQAS